MFSSIYVLLYIVLTHIVLLVKTLRSFNLIITARTNVYKAVIQAIAHSVLGNKIGKKKLVECWSRNLEPWSSPALLMASDSHSQCEHTH